MSEEARREKSATAEGNGVGVGVVMPGGWGRLHSSFVVSSFMSLGGGVG